ncbi:MAG: hypothetical protein ABDI20_02460, partial [Candidatus Bipolaricaulaceae bacterium]
VSMAKSWDMRRARRLGKPVLLRMVLAAWDWFLYLAFGYGYRLGTTWAALALALFVAGVAVFHQAATNGIMVPASSSSGSASIMGGEGILSGPRFNAVLHALDLLLPIPLGYEGRWRVDETQAGGFAVLCFGIGLTAAGWILTSLWVATATGLLQRRI